ncbi:MAG: hypothetical protein CVV49_12950 [Spirochaetae bacterium HGW-Spirochaetae-5]|nr:MAG: hypothetical protein CVV49_12950 [Spirochaetae bacterium HGW-Spirochaetae-5]
MRLFHSVYSVFFKEISGGQELSMKRTVFIFLISASFFFTACGDSFYQAQNYFTGPVEGVGLKKTTSIVSLESEQLYAIVTPSKTENKNVIWTSSDTSVATVDSTGLVKAVAVVAHGVTAEATITVTTEEGGYSAQCRITVVEKPVPVTGVNISKGASSLLQNMGEQLTATVYPSNATNQNLVWSSDNPQIVSVDNSGLVNSSNNTGATTVRVRSVDGGFSASCVFTVTSTPVAVTGISLNKTSTTIVSGTFENLFAMITPANATNQNVTWASSDNSIASVDIASGSVTGVSAGGPVTITATTADGGRTATASVTVVSTVKAVTGVNLNKSSTTIKAGGIEKLVASVLPSDATNQNLIWKSGNSQVATIDSGGVVTGRTAGTASVTVTTVDAGFSKNCTVIVTAEDTYSITYNGNGATSGTAPVDSTSYTAYSTAIVLNSGNLANTGYTFEGWSTTSTGAVAYTAGSTLTIGGNVTLYAVWTANPTYKVIYQDSLRDSGTIPSDSNNYQKDSDVTIMGNPGGMFRAGYRFSGWRKNSSTVYSPGHLVKMGTSDLILTAIWSPFAVYVCGEGAKQYWIDGAGYELDKGGMGLAPIAKSIFVSGDIYIAANQWDDLKGSVTGLYYKNGVITRLPWVGFSSYGAHYSIGSIIVNNSAVYIAGCKWGWGQERYSALMWQTNTDTPANPPETEIQYLGNGSSVTANSIFISGPDVYITGTYGASAAYWKNGQLNLLTGTAANSIVVSGSDVYVAGICDDGGVKPCYWKNGARFILNSTASATSSANCIQLAGGKVHIAGTDATSEARYWVYDASTNAYISDESLFGGVNAYSISIPQSGDIYIAGTTGTKAVYWHNGKPVALTGGTKAYSIVVK